MNEVVRSFSGFRSNDSHLPSAALESRMSECEIEHKSERATEYHVRTRAKGIVAELPNVQPWTLERKRKG